MPIFIYRCPSCYHVIEAIVQHADVAAPRCLVKTCDGPRMEKQPTAAAFTVQGFSAKNGYGK